MLRQYANLCLTSVRQEDCSQQDTAPDELAQRSADLDDLDDLDIEMIGQEDGVVDGLTPAPHYLSQSRSLGRLSRMDTHRVRPAASCQYLERPFLSPTGSKSHFCFFLLRWLLVHQTWLDTCL